MKTSRKSISTKLPRRKLSSSILGGLAAVAASLLLLGGQHPVNAQGVATDDFDSGVLAGGDSGWQVRNVLAPLGAFVEDTFPANGTGKALRLRRGSGDMSLLGFPQAYGTGRCWLFRTNDYTDFYVAMDLVNWNDSTNQAMVLLARATGYDDQLIPGTTPPGLGTVNGYVLNYDNLQDGSGPGDRQGGELQINIVVGEGPGTLCAAEVTLTPGHTYRMVFKGAGSTLTGQIYDIDDLTKPVVTVVADDATYPSGKSGIVTFHRDDTVHPNLSDMTVDNYFSGPLASDPNTDIAPAIRHAIAGTPQVVTRTPANRFTNFHPAASGISFSARTFTASQINASATKLYLNGADVSASLAPFPANGSTVSFSTVLGTLAPNTVYSARIELVDTTGTLTSANTFWFDTFTDASLATLKTIEAEDYNYSNGVYQLDPIPISGLDAVSSPVHGLGVDGLGYFGYSGTLGVDYVKTNTGHYRTDWVEYRIDDRVQITQGSYSSVGNDEAADILDAAHPPPFRIQDTQRSKYAVSNVWEYIVKLTSPTDWMNYTRSFERSNYYVYLRCSSFGDTEVYLDQVTSNPAISNQTTLRLGTFKIDNHIMRLNYKYEPLMAGSHPAVVSLSGLNTLRLTVGGVERKHDRLVNMDYLVFVPTTDSPTIFDDFNDANDTSPLWSHYDPLGTPPLGPGAGFAAASYILTNGTYTVYSPAPPVPDYGPSRAGTFLAGADYTDFYVSADLIDFDDTVRQAFGIAARVNTPGLGSTDGYLFSWEPGSGTLPGTDNGDLDISRLVDEAPIGQIETEPSGLHLQRGKSYRFVFMGHGTNFEGQVYEFPDLANPIKRLPANDPDNLYPSGSVGLITASQGNFTVPGDATFDNFLATTAEPRLGFSTSGSMTSLTWPLIPFRLLSSPGVTGPWTEITAGIGTLGDRHTYSTSTASGTRYFRLVYP